VRDFVVPSARLRSRKSVAWKLNAREAASAVLIRRIRASAFGSSLRSTAARAVAAA
jgi:hypothetical protein